MSSFPPSYEFSSVPAISIGSEIRNEDTYITAFEINFEGSLVMATDNIKSLIIDTDQKIGINTLITSESRLTINNTNENASTLRLSYNDNFFLDTRINSTGDVIFTPSSTNIISFPNPTIIFEKNINISDHNGIDTGLKLGGILITSSAVELNSVDVIPGNGVAFKALVLDVNKNITGINNITSTTFTGTIATGIQLGITEVDTLNVRTELSIGGVPFNLNPANLTYLNIVSPGTAEANRALILNSSRNISNINILTANTLGGILQTASQLNITTIGTLTVLNVSGLTNLNDVLTITASNGNIARFAYDINNYADIDVSSFGELLINASGGVVEIEPNNDFRIRAHNGVTKGLILGTQLVLATATHLNYTIATPGIATENKALILDSDKNITGINSLTCTNINGTILTPSQPNISSVTTLNIINHNTINSGLSLAGTLITATGTKLNYIDTTPGSAQSTKALVVDSTRSISNINTLNASSISGTILTPNQPNIDTVGNLRITNHNGSTLGLTLGAVLVTSTATQLNYVNVPLGMAIASKALILDSNKTISGITSISSDNLFGLIQTSSQPNINMVNILNISGHNGSAGLSLNGVLITSSAIQLNRVNVVPGVAEANKTLILDSDKNVSGLNTLSAVLLSGVITSPIQTFIRTLQSINIEDHNGTNLGLSLGGILVRSTGDQLNYLTTTPGSALANKALVLNGNRDISGINLISSSNLSGTVLTTNQPFITSVNTLNIANHNGTNAGLSLGGSLITVTAAQFNKLNVVDGIAMASRVLILDSLSSITGINSLTASTINGIISTGFQPNINAVSNLDITSHNGNTNGLSLGGVLVTASALQLNKINTVEGAAIPSKALIVDNLKNIIGINSLTAVNLNGIIATGSQPSITSVTTLDITGHNGGSDGLRLGGTLVIATGTNLNTTAVLPGTANALKALVTDSNKSIEGINSLTATRIVAERLLLSGVISNFNTNGILIKTFSNINLNGRIVDIQILPSLQFLNFQPAGLPNNFSSEIYGYIYPAFTETYTFFVNCSDRVRLWVNDVLVLHSWTSIVGFRTSSTIFLNANTWTKIYIQYQVDLTSSALLNVEWSSPSTIRATIPGTNLAWDSNQPQYDINHSTANSFTIFNNSTINYNAAFFNVDTGGDLTIDAGGNDITLGLLDNLNIPAHNGSTRGLILAGVLVTPTANEINYLKTTPGIAVVNKALVTNSANSILGLNAISCTSINAGTLTAGSFTINSLTLLDGPLNNYNSGALLIRQITGPNVSGRIVDVDLVTEINLIDYDPKELLVNYSLDIIGYIKPQYSENYLFYATANDRCRIFVNNTLILNIWDTDTGIEYTSLPIPLVADRWTPIYIQYQNNTGNATLQVKWSSVTLTKQFIDPALTAWDNTSLKVPSKQTIADSLTLFNSQSGIINVQTAGISITNTGALNISSQSGTINIDTFSDLNIISHNGSRGLYLAGALVQATAAELNRVGAIIPGTTQAGKAIILDANKAVSGLSSISSDDIYGLLRTPQQPYITQIGTLTHPFLINSYITVGGASNVLLNFITDSTTAFIQSGTTTTPNSTSDLFIGNYDTNTIDSSRKFMIKSTGFTGIQTNLPNRTLSINGEGATYSLRIINNNALGAETNYTDIGTNSSGILSIEPTGTTTNLLSNLSLGKTSPTSFTISSGTLKISSTSGSIQIGNSTNVNIPLEVGSASFTLTGQVGYINNEGSVGVTTTNPSTYSIRTTSSIIVNGTVCITSDRRLKDDIKSLDLDKCKDFIMNCNPVSFVYKSDNKKIRYGLIAQDVIKSQFDNLVQFTPETQLEGNVDDDGYISPENASMNVSYTEIIPILMKTIKDLYKKNEELENRINKFLMK